MKSMTLGEYDEKVGRHLQMIEAGADTCLRHAHQMAFRPDFETLAFDDLTRAETILTAALEKIQKAIATYQERDAIA